MPRLKMGSRTRRKTYGKHIGSKGRFRPGKYIPSADTDAETKEMVARYRERQAQEKEKQALTDAISKGFEELKPKVKPVKSPELLADAKAKVADFCEREWTEYVKVASGTPPRIMGLTLDHPRMRDLHF